MVMQTGYILIEAGTIRSKNTLNVIVKKLVTTLVTTITFASIGYGIEYGGMGGLFGKGGFFDLNFDDNDYQRWVNAHCFCAITSSIVSGSLSERTFLDTYIILAFFISSLVYPVLACWVWNGGWL